MRKAIVALLMCGVYLNAARGIALSQDVSSTAIEGHVFNAKNGMPLANVVVTYDVSLTGGRGGGASSGTNANGFYQLEFAQPDQVVSYSLSALCRTRRGNVLSVTAFYNSPRAEVYRRDFYITLPRGLSSCAAS